MVYDVDILSPAGGSTNIAYQSTGSIIVSGTAGSTIIISGDIDPNPSDSIAAIIKKDFTNLSGTSTSGDDWQVTLTMPSNGGSGEIEITGPFPTPTPTPTLTTTPTLTPTPTPTATRQYWNNVSSMNISRGRGAGFGTQGAATVAGGADYPSTTGNNRTEEYNGVSWSNSGNLSIPRTFTSGFGTQNAGAVFGGRTTSPNPTSCTNATEEYNGTSWSSGGPFVSSLICIYAHNTVGTQNAGSAFNGWMNISYPFDPNYGGNRCIFEYDGATWSNAGSNSNNFQNSAASGTSNDWFYAGGVLDVRCTTPTNVTNGSVIYNGSSVSIGPNINTARQSLGAFGTSNDGTIFGGACCYPASCSSTLTETYDGTSWSNSPYQMNTARYGVHSAGDSTAGLAAGGVRLPGTSFPYGTNLTEEYNPF